MKSVVAIVMVLGLVGWLSWVGQSLPVTISPVMPPQTPTPMPAPLTDAEAIALVKQEAAARGVVLNSLRITIQAKPRRVSMRYFSSYRADSSVFAAQTVLVALAVARAVARVQPPVTGGIHLAVVPAGESDVGLKAIIMDWPSLEAWANGSISDQEFVSEWTVGTVPKE